MLFTVGASKMSADFAFASFAISLPTWKAMSASNVAPIQVEQGKQADLMPLT
jgi:hypothetical protein